MVDDAIKNYHFKCHEWNDNGIMNEFGMKVECFLAACMVRRNIVPSFTKRTVWNATTNAWHTTEDLSLSSGCTMYMKTAVVFFAFCSSLTSFTIIINIKYHGLRTFRLVCTDCVEFIGLIFSKSTHAHMRNLHMCVIDELAHAMGIHILKNNKCWVQGPFPFTNSIYENWTDLLNILAWCLTSSTHQLLYC